MRTRRGFSLVEMLMVVAILGILSMVGPQLMVQLQNFYLQTRARGDIQRDARTSIENINRFLRQAQYRTIIIDSLSGQGPYSRIRFTTVSGATTTISGANVDFHQNGTQLVELVNGKQTILSNNLVYLAFTFPRSDYPRLVSVSLTMGEATYKGQTLDLELTVQKVRIMN